MLATLHDLLPRARKNGYAVGAFNISNLESAQAVLDAAVELRAPVILQTSQQAIAYAGLFELVALVTSLASRVRIPVVLHFDHGRNISLLRAAAKAGYTSLMFDGSRLPFRENVQKTRMLAKFAHGLGVSIEGELGVIAGQEDGIRAREHLLTDPDEAQRFAELTRVDALAISVGLAHGRQVLREHLNVARVRDIGRAVSLPLVLHGASEGVADAVLKKSIAAGIAKINIDTSLRISCNTAARRFLKKHPKSYNPRELFGACRDAMRITTGRYLRLFGSAYQA